MKARAATILIISFLIPPLLPSWLPDIQAGGTIYLNQETIYSTGVTCSISYPDFRFNQSANISISISATFNNESVSAVNITSIYLVLYYSEVNITQIVSYPVPYYAPSYASTFWVSSDYYESMPYLPRPEEPPPPYRIQRDAANSSVGTIDLQPFSITPITANAQQTRQAKFYVQITFYLLDSYNQAIWRSDWPLSDRGYHWFVYTSEKTIPHVTIYSELSQIAPIGTDTIIVILVLVAAMTGALIMFNAKRHRRDMTSEPKDVHTLQEPRNP